MHNNTTSIHHKYIHMNTPVNRIGWLVVIKVNKYYALSPLALNERKAMKRQ